MAVVVCSLGRRDADGVRLRDAIEAVVSVSAPAASASSWRASCISGRRSTSSFGSSWAIPALRARCRRTPSSSSATRASSRSSTCTSAVSLVDLARGEAKRGPTPRRALSGSLPTTPRHSSDSRAVPVTRSRSAASRRSGRPADPSPRSGHAGLLGDSARHPLRLRRPARGHRARVPRSRHRRRQRCACVGLLLFPDARRTRLGPCRVLSRPGRGGPWSQTCVLTNLALFRARARARNVVVFVRRVPGSSRSWSSGSRPRWRPSVVATRERGAQNCSIATVLAESDDPGSVDVRRRGGRRPARCLGAGDKGSHSECRGLRQRAVGDVDAEACPVHA